jgi:hypothetical protein
MTAVLHGMTDATALGLDRCEHRAAKRLGLSAAAFVDLSTALWGRSFTAERDRRAGPGANPQRRGRATRQVESELAQRIRDDKVVATVTPPMHGTIVWFQREVRELRTIKIKLERERAGAGARCRMLTEYMQSHGVPLDGAVMREAHTQETADRIAREYHHQVLKDFHADISRILLGAKTFQAISPDPVRASLIKALDAATARRRRRMQLPVMEVARKEAERQVARIPASDQEGAA